MVEKELGAPIDELFSEFSAKPIAAASLAQVWALGYASRRNSRRHDGMVAATCDAACRLGSMHSSSLCLTYVCHPPRTQLSGLLMCRLLRRCTMRVCAPPVRR